MTPTTARIFTALMGAWVYLSALAWSRSSTAFALTAGCGLLAVLFSYLAGHVSWAHYASVAVGAVVFLLSFSLYHWGSAAYWNSVIDGIAIAIGGLASGGPETLRQERDFYGRITA